MCAVGAPEMTQMTPESEARRALAYHEAGHAVVEWTLHVPVHDIRIEGLRGCVRDSLRLSQLHPETDFPQLEKLALILFAGEAAERLLDDQAEDFASKDDIEQIDAIAEVLFETSDLDSSAWIEKTKDRAIAIVDEKWNRVRALAEILRERGFVSGQEATRIIANVTSAPNK